MELYFGNIETVVSTIMVVLAVAFIVFAAVRNKRIEHWGRYVGLFAVYGLVLCCFVATRDSYHLSVQSSFDTSVEAGLFTLDSIQSALCCIGGGIIALSSLSCIFVKNQKYRKAIFFIMSGAMLAKMLIIEISRVVM